MDILVEKHNRKIASVKIEFVRSMYDTIEWNNRLIGVKGARGVGKTTLMLQYIKKNYNLSPEALYVNLDDIWFADNSLIELVDNFVKKGGTHLFLDEVHRYPMWSQVVKNIYDDYSELKVVFTGSSLLEILNARADLSRRAVVYQMQGLSYREYLAMYHNVSFEKKTLTQILENHTQISEEVVSQIKPLQHFAHYLRFGYYPFYDESHNLYYHKIEEVINMILEIELPLLRGVEISYIHKVKQLLQIISESVPFIPNVSKLSERIGISRAALVNYLQYLDEVCVISSLFKDTNGIGRLQKPDKIYLENSNLAYTLSQDNTDIGNMRETFFLNQLRFHHNVTYSTVSDFMVDNKYTFEIGGRKKSRRQIEGVVNGYVVSDDIEFGNGAKIPLWMFGFLY